MTKRRISQQQMRRIKKRQQTHLESETSAALEEALVVRHYGADVDVETSQGTIQRCNLRQNLEPIACGDRVIWQSLSADENVIVAVCPRKSLLARPSGKSSSKPMAANIDQIIIVIAPEPKPTQTLIDSYLIMAESLHIQPLLLFNKSDLWQPEFENLHHLYRDLGYRTLICSTQTKTGLEQLITALQQHSSILVGQSGVGKSSLLASLLPDISISIGELSKTSGHGMHTTSVASLYHLPCGGDLIDSPGIRGLGLWQFTPEQIAQGFIEFRNYLGHCKYRDCQHQQEPGCAILEAVHAGKISKERFSSFQHLIVLARA